MSDKRRPGLSLAVPAGAIAAIAGRRHWLPLLGRFLVVADPLRRADAVVALAGGGPERVACAAALFQQGYASWLVVTQTPVTLPGVRATYAELGRQEAVWQGVPEERVLAAPGVIYTTWEEAHAVQQLAQERGWRSLIVVTDPFHTRRARLCYRTAFRGTCVSITVRPVAGSRYRPGMWWQTVEGLRHTWNEYLKLLLHVCGYR